jgi:hypothetical protein
VTEDKDKEDFLCDLFKATYSNTSHVCDLSAVPVRTSIRQIEDLDMSKYEVYKQLKEVDTKTNLSPEGLPAIFFKRAALGLARPLSLIYRRSLDSSCGPNMYKKAWVTPAPKPGKKTDPKNEHPLSLTEVSSCKVTERIVAKQIMKNTESQGLISEKQFAYGKGRCTTDCLLVFLNDIALWTNSGVAIDIVYCDFQSAKKLRRKIMPSKPCPTIC